MPYLTGLDLVEKMSAPPFKIIFATAYDQFALRALKLNALDYLLKPVTLSDVTDAIEKYKKNEISLSAKQLSLANSIYKQPNTIMDTIALSVADGLHFIKTEEIMYIEAMGSYSKLYTNNNQTLVVSKTLSAFEDILTPTTSFFRLHKSFIINLKSVKKYIRGEGGEVIMQDGTSIAVSRTRKQDFLNYFSQI